jgi:hypothetical protein
VFIVKGIAMSPYIWIVPTLDGGILYCGNPKMPLKLISWRKVKSTHKPYIEVETPTSTIVCSPCSAARDTIVRESLAILSDIDKQLVSQLQDISFDD